jgi:NADH dehydrogenase
VLPIPGLEQHAIGFKTLADAIWLRNHVIETLEAANATDDAARRERLLTYVFVGGGYAGLEALAELQDFAADAIESYPRARLHGMRWVLVEAADRVLPEIDAELADYALRELRGRGIDIRLGTTLEEVTARLCRPIPSSGPQAWRRTRACASSPSRSTSAAAFRSTTTCG